MSDQNISGNYRERPILYPRTLTVRVTKEIADQLEVIATFEATKPSTLARREILSMIRRYERNPQFKNWVKRIDQLQAKRDAPI
jgi:hypothetical protein